MILCMSERNAFLKAELATLKEIQLLYQPSEGYHLETIMSVTLESETKSYDRRDHMDHIIGHIGEKAQRIVFASFHR